MNGDAVGTGEAAGLGVALLVIAVLYAAVGQAGASGYLAVMGLSGFGPAAMKTTALALNVVVAGIGTWRFWRAGLLTWRTFYPFGVLGIPFSFLGGWVQLPRAIYEPAVGAILLLATVQMIRHGGAASSGENRAPIVPPIVPALAAGAAVGFVSGVTGTGGGIFLAPLILSLHWVDMRRTAAVTAAYNLLNSAAALAGAHRMLGALPDALPLWIAAVAVGGWLGATLALRRLPEAAMRRVLAVILCLAAAKLLLL
ncbi:UPF0721 transmembrane protein [Allostella sp. ATCC 35155]|nr:UPF0721 transmembrane protein [Stella sp. ATCC 35155]